MTTKATINVYLTRYTVNCLQCNDMAVSTIVLSSFFEKLIRLLERDHDADDYLLSQTLKIYLQST